MFTAEDVTKSLRRDIGHRMTIVKVLFHCRLQIVEKGSALPFLLQNSPSFITKYCEEENPILRVSSKYLLASFNKVCGRNLESRFLLHLHPKGEEG